MAKMKIYTKTGDKGETGLYGGKRVAKSDAIIEALGTLDELNAFLGTIDFDFEEIQKDLMTVAAEIGGYEGNRGYAQRTDRLEREIDRMQEDLPELRNFILPKGQIHYARTICRRAERRVVAAGFKIIYLNRLSDYLFVLARHVNAKNKITEKIWS